MGSGSAFGEQCLALMCVSGLGGRRRDCSRRTAASEHMGRKGEENAPEKSYAVPNSDISHGVDENRRAAEYMAGVEQANNANMQQMAAQGAMYGMYGNAQAMTSA
eukprot:3941838-Rhodomonas_salina.1